MRSNSLSAKVNLSGIRIPHGVFATLRVGKRFITELWCTRRVIREIELRLIRNFARIVRLPAAFDWAVEYGW
jgi:hypothetical protein